MEWNKKMAVTGPSVYRGRHYRQGRPIEVRCENGLIAEIRDAGDTGNTADNGENGSLYWIAPGLVDLQVNGYGGIDLNREPLNPKEFYGLIHTLWSLGVTSFLPTVITNEPSAMGRLLASLNEAIVAAGENKSLGASVPGIHLEGPFISPQDGPRGAHGKTWVMPPDIERLEEWHRLSGERLRIVTFSPEWPASEALARWCGRRNIVASIGHTAADGDQIRAAVKAGAALSTHLGNGAHPVLPRHPNYIWEQMANDDLVACVIADGFHLSEAVLKTIYRAKAGRMLLVSDSVAVAGLPAGRYHSPVGGDVVLSQEGKLYLAEDERLLAGSAKPLIKGVEHLAAIGLCDWQEAWEMASVGPARTLGIPAGQGLAEGAPADFVLMETNGLCFSIKQTVKRGQPVYGG